MYQLTLEGVVELSLEEAEEVVGGNLPFAQFLVGCFAAGFHFGYSTLGPLICG